MNSLDGQHVYKTSLSYVPKKGKSSFYLLMNVYTQSFLFSLESLTIKKDLQGKSLKYSAAFSVSGCMVIPPSKLFIL